MLKEYTVKGMTCSKCEEGLQRAIMALPVVKAATADRTKDLLSVEFNTALVVGFDQDLKNILEDQGFELG